MLIWHFKEYVHGVVTPRGIVSGDLNPGARAELDVILTQILGIRRTADWGLPWYRPLGGGLGEIRYSVAGVEYRVYGSFSYGMTFRMWMVATKTRKRKGKQATDPPDAIEKAKRRKDEFEQRGSGLLRDYEEG